ncbi:MAG: uncharacterized SAM-binding protein YcdF (DUF218 family) [Cryomorphaceae bacterium]
MDSVQIVKIVSAILYPFGLVFTLALLAWLAKTIGAKGWSKGLAVVAFSILLLSSNPRVARWLAFQLERQYPQQHIADITPHDAIIVLGGGLRLPQAPAKHTQIGGGSDRFWYAARLYRSGKAPTIILAGGNVYSQTGLKGEAYYASQLLQQWGVPKAAILIEADSRTTEENRRNTALFLVRHGIKSALLVTSALHMPRAHKSFSQLPIPITPASADVLIREQQRPAVFDWIPSAAALHLSTVALHEYYGVWFKQLKAFMDKL